MTIELTSQQLQVLDGGEHGVPRNAVNLILRGNGYAFISLPFLRYFSCKSYLFGSCVDDFGHTHRRLLSLSSWIAYSQLPKSPSLTARSPERSP